MTGAQVYDDFNHLVMCPSTFLVKRSGAEKWIEGNVRKCVRFQVMCDHPSH